MLLASKINLFKCSIFSKNVRRSVGRPNGWVIWNRGPRGGGVGEGEGEGEGDGDGEKTGGGDGMTLTGVTEFTAVKVVGGGAWGRWRPRGTVSSLEGRRGVDFGGGGGVDGGKLGGGGGAERSATFWFWGFGGIGSMVLL